tara:strand:+ start:51 stop:602 length:552 start_codon:yes stop_codon:yes gene_type:complete
MKKFIEIHDNIVPQYIVNSIENYLLIDSQIPLYYKNNLSYHPTSPLYKFSPGVGNSFLMENNQHTEFHGLFSSVLYSLCFFKNILLKKYIQGRCYVDFPSPNPGPDLPPHVDLVFPHLVCLYYINDSDGDTILFKDDKKTEIQRISPKKGRLILFDGSIPHCGSTSKTNTRAVLNFNFLGEFN